MPVHDPYHRTWNAVRTDNFNRETVADTYADTYVVRGLTKGQADRIVEILRENCTEQGFDWYVVRHNSERLSRGMADLV